MTHLRAHSKSDKKGKVTVQKAWLFFPSLPIGHNAS